ncbi:unnamed protein product [Protopolystoma xenopodis]|uniref:Uncharacterized protein n=1 Tax=Protopolystoma xenopodis TaxID=117903 RepID=A0A448XK97_9PLAT|nr:unnamed protein product [Protopolystoma xenopodis]
MILTSLTFVQHVRVIIKNLNMTPPTEEIRVVEYPTRVDELTLTGLMPLTNYEISIGLSSLPNAEGNGGGNGTFTSIILNTGPTRKLQFPQSFLHFHSHISLLYAGSQLPTFIQVHFYVTFNLCESAQRSDSLVDCHQ